MVAITTEILLVYAIVAGAVVLFVTEPVPPDVVALGVLVALLLADPVAAAVGISLEFITVQQGLSGFSSSATITVLAIFVLSAGVQRTGVVQILGRRIAGVTRDSESRQLGAIVGVVAPVSGVINNTAAVAILLPMVTDLAHDSRISPSKLLIPLSYASMFGGMLTVIGTSTNILASEIAGDVADEAVSPRLADGFSMFEFTALGAIVTVVGAAYLLTVGRRLIPARIEPRTDLTEEYRMDEYLTEVVVRENSPIVGRTVEEALETTAFDVDLLQVIRGERAYLEPLGPRTIQAGDVIALRTDRDTLVELLDVDGLDLVPDATVDDAELEAVSEDQNLVEAVVAPAAGLVGETLASSSFREHYDATVLALRRGGEVVRSRLDQVPLRVGDTLLIQGSAESLDRLNATGDFIVAREVERPDFRRSKIPVALGILAGVVGLAALGVLPIVVSALAGALAMVVTGTLAPQEVYESVQWDVVILLAGVIPLGVAMQETGAAELVAEGLVASADVLPPLLVLGLFYVVTALLTNVISNNASVVLMVPVAYQAAVEMGADPYAFVLAVTFAASTAFMTPVGYQTNLFVYGPGGYRFSDYVRVGAPLQFAFAVATTLGIAVLWGV